MSRFLSALLVFLVFGCAVPPHAFTDEQMLVKASALTKLAAAVESAVRYKGAPESLSEEELLTFATAHDPAMLAPFAEIKLRVRKQGRNSAVLACTFDEKLGLIEDAGCTARSDSHLWRAQPPAKCEFHLDLSDVCKR